MRRLGSQYTRYVNDRRGSDGALFRGRFRSILIDDVSYRSVVGRYIHRNPIALGIDAGPSIYRWSSLRYYINEAEAPSWLRTDVLLAAHTSLSTFCDFTLGSPHVAPTPSIVRWAIDLALHEVFDESERDLDENALLQRTVAVIMLDMADRFQVDLVAAINELISFTNPAARHSAMFRARRRAEAEPLLISVVARALQLCEMTRGV